jgi:nucleotide-binding universal stress UspA family protein
MHTYRIVVGVDGSDAALRALDWAVAEAANRGGTVHAVTAWQWTQPELGTAVRAEHEHMAHAALAAAVAEARHPYPQVSVSAEAVPGPAADVLSRASAEAHLLVLGSHGHGRLFHAVLGSVAEECVRRAVCPVVVVPVPHESRTTAPAEQVTTAVY